MKKKKKKKKKANANFHTPHNAESDCKRWSPHLSALVVSCYYITSETQGNTAHALFHIYAIDRNVMRSYKLSALLSKASAAFL